MWEETFKSHKDSKPKGPEAISLDIAFPSAEHVYGLPQHASDFALKATAGRPTPQAQIEIAALPVPSRMPPPARRTACPWQMWIIRCSALLLSVAALQQKDLVSDLMAAYVVLQGVMFRQSPSDSSILMCLSMRPAPPLACMDPFH